MFTSIVAVTNLSLHCLEKIDFRWVFGIVKDGSGESTSTDPSTKVIVDMLKTLADTRKSKESEFINLNSRFKSMNESQRVQINMFIKHVKVPQGEVLWGPTTAPAFCFFLYSGECEYTTPASYRRRPSKIKLGQLLGDFPALLGLHSCLSELRATTDMEILMVKKEELLMFLGKNPGISLIFRDEYLIE